jgi:uncharacterized protein YcaQ
MARNKLSRQEARRIAVTAAGFGRPRPPRVGPSHLARVVRRLGLLQLDFVNVVVPAHYLVLFSRLGAYDRELFRHVAYRTGAFTEQWAHEASLVPVELWPVLRHRREEHRPRPYPFAAYLQQNPDHVDWALEQVRNRGPLVAADIVRGKAVTLGHDWFTTVERALLEAHFGFGRLAIRDRHERCVRSYDLAERVIPPELFAHRIERADAERELVRIAARGLGVATATDLADYFRMRPSDAKRAVASLVDEGTLQPVEVEGWRVPAYLHREASLPRQVDAAAILSPFDPLVWCRPRVERLFGLEYRLEIFTPPAKRVWGYYVLPFLLGDRIAARVDLRANRQEGTLEVVGSWREAESSREDDARDPADPLRAELETLADWLGLKLRPVLLFPKRKARRR